MKKFKTIYEPGALFGGWAFRATSNGEIVHLQTKQTVKGACPVPHQLNFRTACSIPLKAWEITGDEHEGEAGDYP